MHLTQEPSPFFQDGIYTLKSEFIQPNGPSFFALHLIANSGAENKLKKDRRITLTWAILAVDKWLNKYVCQNALLYQPEFARQT